VRHRPGVIDVLRASVILLAAVASVVVVPRLGPLAPVGPDMVLPVVVAAALLGGPVHGALVGLGAGWVVDLCPPGTPVLGTTALLYAAAGAAAGLLRRQGSAAALLPGAATAAAAATVAAARLAAEAMTTGAVAGLGQPLLRVLLTAALGAVLAPPIMRAERELVRRRFR
jgi:rod shape-determining protein MreD